MSVKEQTKNLRRTDKQTNPRKKKAKMRESEEEMRKRVNVRANVQANERNPESERSERGERNPLMRVLRGVLTDEEIRKFVRSYDMIGDVLLVRLHPDLSEKKREIGKALKAAFPRVRTVAAVPLFGKTHETFRTRDIEVIFGDERTETMHKESGCVFKVDIRHAFFSPRLAYERMRIAKKVKPGENIVNMFAGVGCFSIIIAKVQPKVGKIYSIDINPVAFQYMCENIRLNHVENKVMPVLGDARDVLRKIYDKISRVLMPFPDKACEFLPDVLKLNLDIDKGAVIHYYDVAYDFKAQKHASADGGEKCGENDSGGEGSRNGSDGKSKNESSGESGGRSGRKEGVFAVPYERAMRIIRSAFPEAEVHVEEMRVVRSVGPRKYHVVIDFVLRRRRDDEAKTNENET